MNTRTGPTDWLTDSRLASELYTFAVHCWSLSSFQILSVAKCTYFYTKIKTIIYIWNKAEYMEYGR